MIQRLVDIRTDPTTAFEKDSKILLVRWDTEVITLALMDKETGNWQVTEIVQYKVEGESDAFLQELKQKSTLANYTGIQTRIFVTTPQILLVPKELEGGAALFLKTHFGIKEKTAVFTDEVNEKMIAGFLVKPEKQIMIQKLFPQAAIKSSLGLLVNQALHEAKTNEGVMLLSIAKTTAELTIVQNRQLLLARCFVFTAREDVLYHLLNACRTLDLSSQAVQLILQGQVQKQDTMYQLLQTYFANLQFAEAPPAIQHAAFSQVPSHYLTSLIPV